MVSTKLTTSIVKEFIPPRSQNSHKGDNGKILILGGSYIYHGAPILASLAALRCGTDLVYTAVPKINSQATRAASPNLIVIPLADQKLTRGATRKLLGQIPIGIDSAAIGMGLAIQERGALILLIKTLVNSDVRLLLDASALVPEILPEVSGKNCALCPHAGEYERIFGRRVPNNFDDRVCEVEKMALKYNVVIALKGKTDIISDGRKTYHNLTNTPSMTVGGTGDVLSGITAGMLAKNRNIIQAVSAATFVNGLAGTRVQKQLGLHILATDVCDAIPYVMQPFDRIGDDK
ncbi:MAG: carbohydrate kinase [Cenarchaeum symbiont of Oopsacas minuta]|nr:carbohydrate kinase [Cenarchaeum symbiont of Oopsacas minuta]